MSTRFESRTLISTTWLQAIVRRCFILFVAANLPAAEPADTPAAKPPATPPPAHKETREILIFKDGDRTSGHLIGRDGNFLVFQSTRFGELRVPADSARVEPAPPPAPDAASPAPLIAEAEQKPIGGPPAPVTQDGEKSKAAVRWWTSPAAFSTAVLNYLGPWKGRFAVSLSVTEQPSNGQDIGANLSFSREWENDSAKFDLNYYYKETEEIVNTDLLKGNGLLRHDFKGPYFASYRPSVEWNRNHTVSGVEADYVLLQQSFGLGINLYEKDKQKVSIGFAENLFTVWGVDEGGQSSRDAQSFFAEFDFSLPWRISATGRSTWYYSLSTGDRGWEEQFEITKKFSDTLSLSLRREARHNNPDERIADYALLRLQLGLDF